ncbi:MAG: type II toxin-antitoxin system RelE/ParE family toxin [Thaumarchaeota archaeon]|nr:type II toxin-antitoxin system RelE/ParE family toxin [Nitrososphaerota archaeon]
MAGKILYKSSVRHDLKKINPKDAERILREITEKIGDNPSAGETLSGEFKGLFKVRIGDYRVIYTVVAGAILVLRIGHRSKVDQ